MEENKDFSDLISTSTQTESTELLETIIDKLVLFGDNINKLQDLVNATAIKSIELSNRLGMLEKIVSYMMSHDEKLSKYFESLSKTESAPEAPSEEG